MKQKISRDALFRQVGLFSSVLVFFSASCFLFVGPEEILQQEVSPAGSSKFTLINRGGMATTTDIQRIYLSSPDQHFKDGTLVFQCDYGEGITISWLSDERLEIAFETAHIQEFKNLWTPANYSQTHYYVEVKLKWKQESAIREKLRRLRLEENPTDN